MSDIGTFERAVLRIVTDMYDATRVPVKTFAILGKFKSKKGRTRRAIEVLLNKGYVRQAVVPARKSVRSVTYGLEPLRDVNGKALSKRLSGREPIDEYVENGVRVRKYSARYAEGYGIGNEQPKFWGNA